MLGVQAAGGIRASSAGRSSRLSLASCPPYPTSTPHFPRLLQVNSFGAALCRPPVAAERATHLASGRLLARAKLR